MTTESVNVHTTMLKLCKQDLPCLLKIQCFPVGRNDILNVRVESHSQARCLLPTGVSRTHPLCSNAPMNLGQFIKVLAPCIQRSNFLWPVTNPVSPFPLLVRRSAICKQTRYRTVDASCKAAPASKHHGCLQEA